MTTRLATTHAVNRSGAPRRRRSHAFVVLVSGWLALTAALLLGPCCVIYAAPATSPTSHADAHGEHPPVPCDPWFSQHLDLNGPVPTPIAGGPDVKALGFVAAVSSPGLLAWSLSLHPPVHGPDPPRPIYLTLLRLLI